MGKLTVYNARQTKVNEIVVFHFRQFDDDDLSAVSRQ